MELQQKFLCGPKTGRGFERLQHVFLGFISLARGKVGLRQVEFRGRLVERLQRHHGIVFADRARDNFSARTTGRPDGGEDVRLPDRYS